MKDLLTNDELAAIGAVAVSSAYMESVVDLLLGLIMKLKERDLQVFTGNLMLRTKLEFLQSIGCSRIKSKAKLKRFEDLITEANHLNSQRRTVIHGTWSSTFTEDIVALWTKSRGH